MFSFANEGKVWWRVNLVARDADGGDPTEAPVLLLYKIYTRKELKARERKLEAPLAKLRSGLKNESDLSAAVRDMEALDEGNIKDLRHRVLDWRDIVGADEKPLKFTREVLDAMLDDEAQYSRISTGLLEASKGARAKN